MMEQLKKISIVGAGNIFNAMLGIAFLAAVARNLSIDDVGRYAILTTLLVSMSKVIDFGSNSAFVAEALKKDRQVNNNVFLTLKILMFFPAAILGIAILYVVELLEMRLALTFLLGLVAYGFNIILFTFFQKRQMYGHAVLLNTFPAAFKGFMALVIFLGLQINLETAFQIFSLSMFGCLILLYKLPKPAKNFKLEFDGVMRLFKIGAPGGIALIIQNSWSTIANTLAKLVRDFTNTGIYSIADKVANIFVLISVSIFTVLLPENAIRKENKLKYDLRGTFTITLGVLILAVFTIFAGNILVPIIFGEKFIASTQILGILILASSFTAIHTFLDNYFYVEKKTAPLMYINIVKLVIFVVVGNYLTHKVGLTGLAYAQILSALTALLITGTYIYLRERN